MSTIRFADPVGDAAVASRRSFFERMTSHEVQLPVRCEVAVPRYGGGRRNRVDERLRSLARIAAAIAVGPTASTLTPLVDEGHAAGVSDEEILGTLLAVAPIVGSVRLVRAAPELARAIGYDIDRAPEEPE